MAAILYVAGALSTQQVAGELGVSKTRVWSYLSDLGIPKRPRGRPRRPECPMCGR
jgi:hypothetical protein